MIGQTLSHYRVEGPLGSGGMGVVYRARDLHLERDVALKVLAPDLLAYDLARQRLRREALALSKLNHPHINVVYDFDVQDGIVFLVMELVSGGTLADRLREGALPEPEVLRLGLEVASALEAAHEAGVLHRDLKPSNVMVTPRGEAKVLDFGLAKRLTGMNDGLSTLTLTEPQALTGTLPYMAPELLLGHEADERSDLYALGVMLYEMATGRLPHPETQSFALASAILNQAPPAPRTVRAQLSPAFEAILLKCLAKDPAARYRRARDLVADLEAPGKGVAARRARLGVLAKAALLVLVAMVGGALLTRALMPGRKSIRSLAVLPLENLSNDPQQEYFVDGMTDELTTTLAQVQGLTVIARSSAMGYKNSKKPLRQIARELGVQGVVEGAVRRVGDQVRISAELVEPNTNKSLWARAYQRGTGDALSIQSDVALSIADQIRLRLRPDVRARLATRRKIDPEAHEAYLKGRYHFNQYSEQGARQAIEDFRRAIEVDPGYAEAYAGLSDAYASISSVWLPASEAMPKAEAAARRALELDPQLASAHASLAYVRAFYDWQWADAERGFHRAIELNPNEPTAHQNYGTLLVAERRFDEASRELERSSEIDPLSPMIGFSKLISLNESRQYERAIDQGTKLSRDYPTFAFVHLILGQANFFKGDPKRGIQELQTGYRLQNHPVFLAWQGYELAASGEKSRARQALHTLESVAETTYVQPYFFALVHAGLGEKDRALEWLAKAQEKRSEELIWLQVDRGMDPLRSDPRFAEVLRRMGFPRQP